MQRRRILRVRVVGGAARHPPEMGEGDDVVGRADQRGQVLRRVAGRRDEVDGGREVVALGGTSNPEIVAVDRLEVVDARIGEQPDE